MQNQSYLLQDKLQTKIKYQTRVRLIELVNIEKSSIKKACKLLNINYSTGKLIMKKFAKDGSITKFSHQKLILSKENSNIIESNNFHDCDKNQTKNNTFWMISSFQNCLTQQSPYSMWINSPLYDYTCPTSPESNGNNFFWKQLWKRILLEILIIFGKSYIFFILNVFLIILFFLLTFLFIQKTQNFSLIHLSIIVTVAFQLRQTRTSFL